MKRLTAAFVAVALGVFLVAAVNAAEFDIFTKAGYLNWTEKTPLSKRDPFVKESGPVFSVGGSALFRLTENISSRLELEGLVGGVNYKGQHLSDWSPYNTISARLGVALEGTLMHKIKTGGDFFLSPFASLGFSVWWREVCAETWYAGYGKIGIQAEKGPFFGKVGLLLPFYTEAHGCWAGVFWVNGGRETKFWVTPKGVPTPFAEIGIRHKRITIGLFYEEKKWKESNWVGIGGGVSVFQPETTQSLIGIKIGYFF